MRSINLLTRNLGLSTTNNIILESVKRFAREELTQYQDKTATSEQTREIYRKFGEMGILGCTADTQYTMKLPYKMYGLIAKEIEYVDSGLRSMFSVQSSLVINPIYRWGSPYLVSKYIEPLAEGSKIGCFGLTEPDSGSDAGSMRTRAVLDGNDYIINGGKIWITNSPVADVMIVWAKENDTVSGFVLDRTMHGIETPEIKRKMSLMSSATGMINLTDVRVPKENKLKVSGMKGPLTCLNDARLGISFGVLGAAEFCIRQVIDYGLNRKLFGSLLAEKQLYQSRIADMTSEYNLALLGSLNVADHVDRRTSHPEMISLVKRNNCQKSLNIARNARDMLGGNGITQEYNVFRHMINLETVNTYEGTHDIHTLILGKYLTTREAF